MVTFMGFFMLSRAPPDVRSRVLPLPRNGSRMVAGWHQHCLNIA